MKQKIKRVVKVKESSIKQRLKVKESAQEMRERKVRGGQDWQGRSNARKEAIGGQAGVASTKFLVAFQPICSWWPSD